MGKDSPLFEEAYSSYKRTLKSSKLINIKYKVKSGARKQWLVTHREYLRWRKTDDFQNWKKEQFIKQGGTCYYCDLPIYGGVKQNVEHVLAKISGGTNNKNNLVLACSNCNKKKGTKRLTAKQLASLQIKNKQKRGTYLANKDIYKTEYDLAVELRDKFREE